MSPNIPVPKAVRRKARCFELALYFLDDEMIALTAIGDSLADEIYGTAERWIEDRKAEIMPVLNEKRRDLSHLLRPDLVKLSVDMMQRRDDMRRILGSHYEDRVNEARAVLRGVMEEKRLGTAEAGLDIAKKMSSAGYDPSIIIAAIVEESES